MEKESPVCAFSNNSTQPRWRSRKHLKQRRKRRHAPPTHQFGLHHKFNLPVFNHLHAWDNSRQAVPQVLLQGPIPICKHNVCSVDLTPVCVGFKENTRIIPCTPQEFISLKNRQHVYHLEHPVQPAEQGVVPINSPINSTTPRVLATTINGTTFFHKDNSINTPLVPKPCANCLPHVKKTSCECKHPMPTINTTESLNNMKRSEAFSSSRIQESHGGSSNHYQPISSFSSSTSRSSSPFVMSADTASVSRDSGLVSMESTDEENSVIHERDGDDKTEESTLELIIKTAEETMIGEKEMETGYFHRQLRRSHDGYVSIKLLASLKSMKKITNCYNTLVLALRKSKKLSLNSTSTKVKKRNAIFNHSQACKDSTALLVTDPNRVLEIEDVMKQFKKYGPIAQLRIVRPDRPIPQHLKGYTTVAPQLGKMVCAIVEFEEAASTKKAYDDVIGGSDGIAAAILGPKLKRNLRKNNKQHKTGDVDFEKESYAGNGVDAVPNAKRKVTGRGNENSKESKPDSEQYSYKDGSADHDSNIMPIIYDKLGSISLTH